jgi:hypothetical protein
MPPKKDLPVQSDCELRDSCGGDSIWRARFCDYAAKVCEDSANRLTGLWEDHGDHEDRLGS